MSLAGGMVLELGMRLTEDLDESGERLAVEAEVLLDNLILVGSQGAGKSSLGMVIVDRVREMGCPVLVVDTTGDISERLIGQGARLHRGFADDPAPTDEAVQLNALEMSDASVMFARPTSGAAGDEVWVEEAARLVRALLDVLGYRTRGVTPEALLLETLTGWLWQNGHDPDLSTFASHVIEPPFRRLGLFELDLVIDSARRADLAAAILGLVDTPWAQPAAGRHPIDLDALLSGPSGSPAVTVLSFTQRSDVERRFLIAVLLAKLRTFVHHRPDTGGLSMVVLIDEGNSVVPAGKSVVTTEMILEMLDGWARFGVAVGLVTEHPHQLDERALDRAHTWIVGSMPVPRSRREVIEELDLVNPPIDENALERTLQALQPGQFVIRSPRLSTLDYFRADRR